MRNLIRLSIAVALENFWRFTLSTLAIAAAATVVLWMASTYHAIFQSFDDYANLAFGRYQLAVAPIDFEADLAVPQEAVDALRQDKRIKAVDTYGSEAIARVDLEFSPSQSARASDGSDDGDGSNDGSNDGDGDGAGNSNGNGNRNTDSDGGDNSPRRSQLTYLFMTTESRQPPHPMVRGNWLNTAPTTSETNDAKTAPHGIVLREDVAKAWRLDLGDPLRVRRSSGAIELVVQGIVSAPLLTGASSAAIHALTPNQAECFVPPSAAKEIFSVYPKVNLAGVQVAQERDIHSLRFDWAHRLSQFEQPVQFQHAYELEEQLDQSATARSIQIQSYVAIAFSALLTAIATLWGSNLGVESKIQQLGMLRALGFTRFQIAAIPVFEGLLRGAIAWTLALMGAVCLQSLPIFANATIFKYGVSVQGGLGAAGAISIGCLLAIASQLRIALRVHPLDAIAVSNAVSETSSMTDSAQGFDAALGDAAGSGLEHGEKPSKSFRMKSKLSLALASGASILAVVVASNKLLNWSETATAIVVAASLVVAFLSAAFAGYAPFWRTVLRLTERHAPTQSLLLKQQISHIGMRNPIVPIGLSACLTLFLAIHIWGATLMEAFVPGDWLPDAMAHRKSGFTSAHLDAFQKLPGVDENKTVGVHVEQVRLADDILGSQKRSTVTRQDNVLMVGIDPVRAWNGESPLLDVVWQAGNKQEAVEQLKSHRGCLVVDHFLQESGLKLGDRVRFVPPRRKASEAVEYTIVGALELPGWHWQTKHTQMRTRSHRTAAIVFIDLEVAAKDYELDTYSHLWFNRTAAGPSIDAIGQRSVELLNTADPIQIVTSESIRERVRKTSRQWLWIISVVPMVGLAIATLSFVQMQFASLRSRSWELGVLRSLGFQRREVILVWVFEIALILTFALAHSFIFGWLVSYCAVHYTQKFSFFGGVDTPTQWPLQIFAWCLLFGATIVLAGGFAPARHLLRKTPMQLLHSTLGFESRRGRHA